MGNSVYYKVKKSSGGIAVFRNNPEPGGESSVKTAIG